MGLSSQRSNEIESVSTSTNTNFDSKLQQFSITTSKFGLSQSKQDGYSSVTKIYNRYGFITKAYSSNKSSFQRKYDSLGRLISITDQSNIDYPLTTKYQYIEQPNSKQIVTISPTNWKTIDTYNSLDQATSRQICPPNSSCFLQTMNFFNKAKGYELEYSEKYLYDKDDKLISTLVTNYDYNIYGELYSTFITTLNGNNISPKTVTLQIPPLNSSLQFSYLNDKIYGNIEASTYDPYTDKRINYATYSSNAINSNGSNIVNYLSLQLASTTGNEIPEALLKIFNSDGSLSNNFIKKLSFEYNDDVFPSKTYLSINDSNGGNSVNNQLIQQINYNDNTKQVANIIDASGNTISRFKNLLGQDTSIKINTPSGNTYYRGQVQHNAQGKIVKSYAGTDLSKIVDWNNSLEINTYSYDLGSKNEPGTQSLLKMHEASGIDREFTYTPDNKIKDVYFNGDIQTSLIYNNFGEVISKQNAEDSFTYKYDPISNFLTETTEVKNILGDKYSITSNYIQNSIGYIFGSNNQITLTNNSGSKYFKTSNIFTPNSNGKITNRELTISSLSGSKSTFSESYKYNDLGLLINKVNSATGKANNNPIVSSELFTYNNNLQMIKKSITVYELSSDANEETNVFPDQEIPYLGDTINYTAEYNNLGYLVNASTSGIIKCQFIENSYPENGVYSRYCDSPLKYTEDYNYNFITGHLIKSVANFSSGNMSQTNTTTYNYDSLNNIIKKINNNDTYIYEYTNPTNPYLLQDITKNNAKYASYNYLPTGEVSSYTKQNNEFNINYTPAMKVKSIINNTNDIVTSYGYDLNNVLTSKTITLNNEETSEVSYFAGMMINYNADQISMPYSNLLLNLSIYPDKISVEVANMSLDSSSLSGSQHYKFKVPIENKNINNANNLADFQSYSPFGIKNNDQNLQSIFNMKSWSPISSANTEIGYQNQLTNIDSGLQYLGGNRLYDPDIGRFLQRDPLGHEYTYADNNPIIFNDPSGLIKKYKEKNHYHTYHDDSCDGVMSIFCTNHRQGGQTAGFTESSNESRENSQAASQSHTDTQSLSDMAIETVSIATGLSVIGGVGLVILLNHYAFGDTWKQSSIIAAENEIVTCEGVKAGIAFSQHKYIQGTAFALSELMLISGFGIENGALMKSEEMIIDAEIKATEIEGEMAEERANRIKEIKTRINKKYERKYKYRIRNHARSVLKDWSIYNYVSGRTENKYVDTSNWESFFKSEGIIYATNLAGSALEGVPTFDATVLSKVYQKIFDYPVHQLPVLIYDGPAAYGISIATGIGPSLAFGFLRWGTNKIYKPYLFI